MNLRTLVVTVLILGLLCTGLGIYRSSLIHKTQTPPESTGLSESLDEVEDDTTFMNVENQIVLYEEMPDIATSVINQLYAKQYEESGVLNRYAIIEDDVSRVGNKYMFTIRFYESNATKQVTITVNNVATDDYTLLMEDVS